MKKYSSKIAEVMALTRIFLIRHGETEWNKLKRLQGHSDVKLSAEGIRQARVLSMYAPFQQLDAFYSSDLARAVMTAEILAAKFNLPVIKIPGLRETNFGDWEGKSIVELATELPNGFKNFFTAPEKCKPPHGETFLQCQARVMNALDKIIAAHENQNVVVVSHGAAIRLIICAALNIPINKMWSIGQFNAAVNILRVDDGNFTLELMNGTAHLNRPLNFQS